MKIGKVSEYELFLTPYTIRRNDVKCTFYKIIITQVTVKVILPVEGDVGETLKGSYLVFCLHNIKLHVLKQSRNNFSALLSGNLKYMDGSNVNQVNTWVLFIGKLDNYLMIFVEQQTRWRVLAIQPRGKK